MKIFKAFLAVILACCCLLSAVPAMAAEVETTNNPAEVAVDAVEPRVYPTPNEFQYNPATTTDMTFEITKNNIKYFKYTSGSFGTEGRIVIRLTNVETGTYCNHNLFGNVANSRINCNIGIGTYRVSIIENPNSVGYFTLTFFSY